jgi:hypothetical protein
MIDPLTVPGALLERVNHGGSFASVAHNAGLEALLRKRYGRDGLCLKIFPKLKGMDPEALEWGGIPVRECSRVQNLFALHNLAPLVVDLALVNGLHLAQATEWACDHGGAPDLPLLHSLIDRTRVRCTKQQKDRDEFDLDYDANWCGGWMIDWCGTYFADPPAYELDLLARLDDAGHKYGDFTEEICSSRVLRVRMELVNWLGHWSLLRHLEEIGE